MAAHDNRVARAPAVQTVVQRGEGFAEREPVAGAFGDDRVGAVAVGVRLVERTHQRVDLGGPHAAHQLGHAGLASGSFFSPPTKSIASRMPRGVTSTPSWAGSGGIAMAAALEGALASPRGS